MPEEVAAGAQGAVAEQTDNSEVSTDARAKAGAGEPQENAEQGENANQPQKRKGGFQRKIERLEQEREYWRNAALSRNDAGASTQQTTQPTKTQEAELKEPKLEDFNSLAEYDAATKKFYREVARREAEAVAEEREKKRAEAEQQRRQQETQQERAKRFAEQEAKAAEKYADYEEVTTEAIDLFRANQRNPALQAVAAAVMESDVAGELMYELGKNTAEVERLAKLQPLAAVKELGKIEARLASDNAPQSKDPEEEKPAVSRAPKPPAPVSKGSGAKRVDLNDPNVPMDEWLKERNAQLKRK